MIVIKTAAEVDAIRASGMILREVFTQLEDFIRPGLPPRKLITWPKRLSVREARFLSFLNYGGSYGIRRFRQPPVYP